ncbi:HD domain-containing protein [Geotalea sp. SG265]|uniref:HD domain-containing protein n=1 Tax=Geotalea sp. SG265 TaxID=2922867 RepID=UPI001FAEED17|nr:HD domain-containing protein [Geotalea sp. SG265]
MDAAALLKKYFTDGEALAIVFEHSRLVAARAREVACTLAVPVDIQFVEEAALLHDIGVCRVHAPKMGCFGSMPYICHGIAGREILEAEGLSRHALVCERHIGVGLTAEDVRRQQLPLPERDMVPLSLEEEIICFADLFYSKNPETVTVMKSRDEVRASLEKFGAGKTTIFDRWCARLCPAV